MADEGVHISIVATTEPNKKPFDLILSYTKPSLRTDG